MNTITTKDGTPSFFIERGAAAIMVGALSAGRARCTFFVHH